VERKRDSETKTVKSSCPSPIENAGLTPLDEERARSMADEGGASGAVIEVEGECEGEGESAGSGSAVARQRKK